MMVSPEHVQLSRHDSVSQLGQASHLAPTPVLIARRLQIIKAMANAGRIMFWIGTELSTIRLLAKENRPTHCSLNTVSKWLRVRGSIP